ncbi:transcriptional regulator [Kurthia sp. 3B1D]|uniref:Transcriptional regulator n=1 Tax=Candidatus Kurthia intestinigallinarum TaxID=1562256 RepID=A0A433RUN0_9BACL|nr:response regulator transcription factor [Kurthia sp. 3B1D]RUS56978.1 transcriptional regulator [Kurthia sp. 3B1D]
MEQGKILLVDDEIAILTMLKTILTKEGFAKIDTAITAEEALSYCKQQSYDLILLDVMLPGQSGFDICPQIRQLTNAPIFFVTARTSDLDKLSGFALGGDDYITKPFNPLEVVARIKAQLRRIKTQPEISTILQFPQLTIHTASGDVYFQGKAVELSAQVYQLLLFFAKHPNQLFTKSQLYENVWQDAYLGEDNTVMVHIRKLRQKIEDNPSNPERIVTVRGLGYKFVPGNRL